MINVFIACSYLRGIENIEEEKMEKKVTMWLKNSFSDHWLMVRLNLSSDDVRNCNETTFVKERNSQFGV